MAFIYGRPHLRCCRRDRSHCGHRHRHCRQGLDQSLSPPQLRVSSSGVIFLRFYGTRWACMFASKKDRTRRFQKPRAQHKATTQRTRQDARLGCTALFRDSESEAPSIATAFEKCAGEAENGRPRRPERSQNRRKFDQMLFGGALGRLGSLRVPPGTRQDALGTATGRQVGLSWAPCWPSWAPCWPCGTPS